MVQKKKRNKASYRKILTKILFVIVFLSISAIYCYRYLDFYFTISNNNSIHYSFIERRINKGGRGETFEMDYQYIDKGTVNITGSDYQLIANGTYPELYYSKISKTVFSKWEEKRALRISLLFLGFSIVALLPWDKLFNEK